MEAGWSAVTSRLVTLHPVDGVDAQDVKAFGHDGGCGFTEEHPPHVDLNHLTWRERHTESIRVIIEINLFLYV